MYFVFKRELLFLLETAVMAKSVIKWSLYVIKSCLYLL